MLQIRLFSIVCLVKYRICGGKLYIAVYITSYYCRYLFILIYVLLCGEGKNAFDCAIIACIGYSITKS